MIPQTPYLFRAGKVFTPDDINGNFRRLLDFQAKEADRRWAFDTLIFNITPMTVDTAGAGVRQLAWQMPRAYRIIGRELVANQTAGADLSVSITDGTSTMTAISGTAPTNALLWEQDLESLAVAANTQVTATISTTGTSVALTQGFLVVHVVYDRHEGSLPSASFTEIDSNTTLATAKTQVNDGLAHASTGMAQMNTALAANTRRQRTTVVPLEPNLSVGVGNLRHDMLIPDDGGLLDSIQIVHCSDVGLTNVGFEIRDDVPAQVAVTAGTDAGAGTGTLVVGTPVSVNLTMDGDFLDSAHDWTLRWQDAGAGTTYHAHALLYWTY